MRVVDTIRLSNGKRIDLCVGDLTQLPRRAWFNPLIVSVFAGSLDPYPGTLIEALHDKGIGQGTREDQGGRLPPAPRHVAVATVRVECPRHRLRPDHLLRARACGRSPQGRAAPVHRADAHPRGAT